MEKVRRERPIIFSGEMVKAILGGGKTQTRRVVKPQPFHRYRFDGYSYSDSLAHFIDPQTKTEIISKCPYGAPGNRLWVRETFCLETDFNMGLSDYQPPFQDGRPVQWSDDPEWGNFWSQPHYKATDPTPDLCYDDQKEEGPCVKWKPSIHMPRWASRILLEITGVWVERLNDIMPECLHKEGIPDEVYFSDDPSMPMNWFRDLWNSINEKRGFGWDKNPWVWVVEFKVVKPCTKLKY